MKICERCKKEYTPSGKLQKYCGHYKLKIGCSWVVYREQQRAYDYRNREKVSIRWRQQHPERLVYCVRCNKKVDKPTSQQKYCGSLTKRIGCSWIVHREQDRAWAKAKYHRIKNTPEYQVKRKKHATDTYHRLKDHYTFWAKNRQQRLRAAAGDLKLIDWSFIKTIFNNTCPGCNKQEPEIHLGMDHKIPIRFGGTHYADNIQPLCNSCNRSKWCNTQFAAQRILDRQFHLVQYGNPVVRRSNVFYAQAS